MKPEKIAEALVSRVEKLPEKSWFAWLDKMPPQPDDMHVSGKVLVPNPGVLPLLLKREPQGINPTILQLDLILLQQPGLWPQVITKKRVKYDETGGDLPYQTVDVFFNGEIVLKLEVQIVQ